MSQTHLSGGARGTCCHNSVGNDTGVRYAGLIISERRVPGPAILSEELEMCPMICFILEAMVRGALDWDAVVQAGIGGREGVDQVKVWVIDCTLSTPIYPRPHTAARVEGELE
jgi:hypothetical protein